ncbi:hypothetical protein [Klebsiella grimontii]|uniref:hypothetical protein n=1 Tax=Klebsiella grimontii TaxID=2058152 RepID=UPI0012B7E6A2|nr:hypothetical protein [Klebsiella grimontii]
MLIKSIDDAVRKAVADAGDVFRGQDIEKIIKEACDKGAERVDLKMPVTIATKDEPWIYISSAVTIDRNFEIYVIVDLSDVSEDYLKAKVYQGVFLMNRPRPAISVYERSVMIKAEDYEQYVGSNAVKNFAKFIRVSSALTSPEHAEVLRSVEMSLTRVVAVMPDMPTFVADAGEKVRDLTTETMSVFEAPTYSRSFSLNSPPGVVDMILANKGVAAETRFNESIDRQLLWEVDGDMVELEAVKAVSKSFGGLFTKPSSIIKRQGYNKSAAIAEGKSYALAHVREVIKNAEVHTLIAKNPLWGSW